MPKKGATLSIKPKRNKANLTISINKQLYDTLEALRTNRVGSTEIIDDRSDIYERMLILGLQAYEQQQRKLELLEKLDTSFLESLNLEEVDLSKINPELLKRRTNSSPM